MTLALRRRRCAAPPAPAHFPVLPADSANALVRRRQHSPGNDPWHAASGTLPCQTRMPTQKPVPAHVHAPASSPRGSARLQARAPDRLSRARPMWAKYPGIFRNRPCERRAKRPPPRPRAHGEPAPRHRSTHVPRHFCPAARAKHACPCWPLGPCSIAIWRRAALVYCCPHRAPLAPSKKPLRHLPPVSSRWTCKRSGKSSR